MQNRLEAEKNWDQSFKAGTTYLMADRLLDAEKDFKAAVALAESLGEPDARLVQSLNGLALTYFKKNDLDFAEPTYLRTVELADGIFGPQDPRVLPYLNGLAYCLLTSRKYARAQPLYERALSITEKARGHVHADLTSILRNLGTIYEQLQKLPEAKRAYEHLVAVYDATNPADSTTIRGKISKLVHRNPELARPAGPNSAPVRQDTKMMSLQELQEFSSPTKPTEPKRRPTQQTPGKGGVSITSRGSDAAPGGVWEAIKGLMSTDVVEIVANPEDVLQTALETTGQRQAAERSRETTGQRKAAQSPETSGARKAAPSPETSGTRKAAPSPETSGPRPAAPPSPETTGQRPAAPSQETSGKFKKAEEPSAGETTGQRKSYLAQLAGQITGQFKKAASNPGDKPKAAEPVETSHPQGVAVENREALVGRVIENRYKIDAYLGAGGMSIVYKGTHIMMARPVAIKVMQAHVAEKQELLQRFQQEARAAHSLSHPNIAAAHDFGMTQDGLLYLVMDYVEGKSLEDLIKDLNHIPLQRCIPILAQICDAVGYAHDTGLLHRDLKPSNIMLVQSGGKPDVVKIVDFGLAKFISTDPEIMKLTRTGEFVGSPIYTSPEQLRGQALDARSDIYALGLVAYECLTGKQAVSGETYSEVLVQHFAETPISFAEANPGVSIPKALEKAIFKSIEKEPAKRHATMADFKKDLEAASG